MTALELSRTVALRPPSALSSAELSDLLNAADILESVISQARKEAEKRLAEGKPVEGYEMAPGRPSSSIMDPAAAFRILEPVLGENALLDCCMMGLGKLEKAIAAHRNCTLKEAKEYMGQRIGKVILTEPGKPKLSRAIKTVEIADANVPQLTE